jgi:hypothetical protein
MRLSLRTHYNDTAPVNPHPLPNLPLEGGGTQAFPSLSGEEHNDHLSPSGRGTQLLPSPSGGGEGWGGIEMRGLQWH